MEDVNRHYVNMPLFMTTCEPGTRTESASVPSLITWRHTLHFNGKVSNVQTSCC